LFELDVPAIVVAWFYGALDGSVDLTVDVETVVDEIEYLVELALEGLLLQFALGLLVEGDED
jgi:hypothetical protein